MMRASFYSPHKSALITLSLFLLLSATAAHAQTTSFTYQGRLQDGGTPANGSYDLQFALWDSLSGGTQIGATQTVSTVAVSAGIFSVQLDFGATAFPGANRFLEIKARLTGVASFTTLSPRQQITSTPYAVRSLNASSADTIPANALPAGSTNYIQNTTTTQAGANFNIGGNGSVGGNLTVSGAVIFSDGSQQTRAGVTGSGIAGTVPLWGSTKELTFTTMQVSNNGNLSIGFAQNQHRLNITGGPLWTSNSWSGALALGNASAIGWNANAGGQRFGIGQSTGGLYFFHTASDPGTTGSPANYDMTIGDDGHVGIGQLLAGNDLSLAQLEVQSGSGNAIFGYTAVAAGVGVFGQADAANGFGVFGTAVNGGQGVRGSNGGSNTVGYAGRFNGRVDIFGNLSKSTGSFKIDHPLDPANKYLYHSFVESPDMMNIYNGVAVLDDKGEATVALPDWFEALNKDFRYQLTAIGAPGPNLYIAEEVKGNKFRIAGGQAAMKVSWQVTGVRHDAYANANRIQVEEEKPEQERGFYRHPEVFGQPEERSVEWARNPELMRREKEQREKVKLEELRKPH